ncbi:lysozyme [Candidatus Symbiopectobacterium sp.]|uniref:lysozyme n=1 Tax=Candidatus Symbiopectobacterium sp. TaxID=2816440 RepID=UPI0025BB949D|nr:lysozyme [Candidatus Symbiopectobacterium sp.]
MSKASKLSAAMLALIAAGALAPVMMAQFQTEKEGMRINAYPDGGGIWTICGGVTRVDGKPVVKGMKLTAEQCANIDAAEQQKALDWVDRNVKVPLTEIQKVGIASFCPWNIGPGKCFPSTFYRKLNAGDLIGACKEIKRWIWDGGKDCRIRSNNCYGQIERRDQEAELSCWGLDT